MNSPWDDTVSKIQAAKDADYVVPPELAKIGDGIANIAAWLPDGSFGKFLGFSYVVALAENGFRDPGIEEAARFMVLRVINDEENKRYLGIW